MSPTRDNQSSSADCQLTESAMLEPRDSEEADEMEPLASAEPKVEIEMETRAGQELLYRVGDKCPIHLLVMFALQQCLLVIVSPLSKVAIVAEVVCATHNDVIKTKMLSATLLMTGLATFLMPLVGVRLPIFQGPAQSYIVPLLAMMSLEEWQCPEAIHVADPVTNETLVMAQTKDGSYVTMDSIAVDRIQRLSGGLILAGVIHFLIGAVGLVGFIVRHVGPVTVVPTVVLVGVQSYKVVNKFGETDWMVTAVTAASAIILSQYLANRKTPIPFWSRDKGFHIFLYPLHQVFAILFSMAIGWLLCAALTSADFFTSDPNSKQFLARTDARSNVIEESPWFVLPYPGQFGTISFSIGGFINFMVATILSILDSIGDYRACARTAQVPAPPSYAFNRGIALEGLISTLGGALGCCHATSSYGGNIGAMGMTKVVSRQVFWMSGLIYILFSVLGKLGAFFNTIPYPVLGGINFVSIGIFIGVILSMLQSVEMLDGRRNITIVGVAFFLGLVIPRWCVRNPNAIKTGIHLIDISLKMMLSNPSFVGGLISCFLDNTVPGTLEERGLKAQLSDLAAQSQDELEGVKETETEVYELPYLPAAFRKSRVAKLLPFINSSNE